MATLDRLRVQLAGGGVAGPGVMTLYTLGLGGDLQDAAETLMISLQGLLPNDVSFTFPGAGDSIEDSTGELVGSWTGGGSTVTAGTGTGPFMLGTGFGITWATNGIVAGRRVKGRTFVVPAISSCFDTTGFLDVGVRTTINNAIAAFRTDIATEHAIWSRPVPGRAGTSHPVTAGAPMTKPVWLTTRKF